MKYTPAGGHVWLKARAEGTRVVFECANDGPGIAPDDLPHVRDRLYRADPSRTQKGLGLGLSLVRAIARADARGTSVGSSAAARRDLHGLATSLTGRCR